MPKLNAKEVSTFVREYFDEIKQTKFIFDIINVRFYNRKNEWEIECEVANLFDGEPRRYTIHINDKTGVILDVSEIE